MEYGKQHTDGSRSGGQPLKQTPKLLTKAELERAYAQGYTALSDLLHNNGLIADEPVDPLRTLAGELALAIENRAYTETPETALYYALRARGKELRPTLTREMVAAAWERYAVHGPYGADGLHAALMEQMQ